MVKDAVKRKLPDGLPFPAARRGAAPAGPDNDRPEETGPEQAPPGERA